MNSDIKIDIYVASGLAAVIGLLGLWPHLEFIIGVGEFRYFHYAYDEDTYILGWLNGALRSTRLLSGFALSAVNLIAAGSLNATMILSDFLFPAIAVLSAYFAASQIVVSRPFRALIALTLVFAGDLFSLGSFAVWSSSALNISRFSQIVGQIGPNLVPAYETSFLSIYRTPEPQVSLTLMFVVFGLLAKFAKGDYSTKALAMAVVAIALLPFGYTFVTFPVALIAGGALIVFFASRRKSAAAAIIIGFCGAMTLYVLVAYWQHDHSQSTTGVAAALSYHTRLPIITPAVLVSLVFSVAFGAWLAATRGWTPSALLALGCLVTPLVLSNQQILTDMMISARDWERNASYQILAFGSALAVSIVAASRSWRALPISAVVSTGLALLIVFIAGRGQALTYRMWQPFNEASVAMVHALSAVDQKELSDSRLALANAGLAPILQLRSDAKLNIPLSFYRAGIDLIPNMSPSADVALPSPFEPAVFDHWMHVGIDPERAEEIVRSEIQQRAGTYISFLFSFRDSWYPASDNRAVRPVELERSVGPLIARYRDYFKGHKDDTPRLLITDKPLRKDPAAEATVGHATAYLYRQVPSH